MKAGWRRRLASKASGCRFFLFAIEEMTIGLSRTGPQGADATERIKRCIRTQMLGMIAHRTEQGGCTIGADAVGLPKVRAGLLGELVEVDRPAPKGPVPSTVKTGRLPSSSALSW